MYSIDLLVTVPVEHCFESYGIVFIIDGVKVLYSGDCRPSLFLEKIGQDADIYIHEATFSETEGQRA